MTQIGVCCYARAWVNVWSPLDLYDGHEKITVRPLLTTYPVILANTQSWCFAGYMATGEMSRKEKGAPAEEIEIKETSAHQRLKRKHACACLVFLKKKF